jgi:uncharacterized protein
MTQMVFINLPVADVVRSRAFYTALGFSINEQFSDEAGACVVVSDTIFIMVLSHTKFDGFITLPRADTAKTTTALFALNRDDRAGVDAMMTAALTAGGTEPKPATDHGFMYTRTFMDPDGNTFEPFWMDPAAIG